MAVPVFMVIVTLLHSETHFLNFYLNISFFLVVITAYSDINKVKNYLRPPGLSSASCLTYILTT